MDKNILRIGIMGGTFNPIHLGHLEIAKEALLQYNLDKIWFMPNKIPAYKSVEDILDETRRVEMIRLAIEDNEKFELSTFELERLGVTYTYETLELLKQKYENQEYYFIMGADSLATFSQWKYPDIIAKNCVILVSGRDDIDDERIEKYISAAKVMYNAEIYKIKNIHVDISSNMVRNKIANNCDVSKYVPQKVCEYISQNNLYLKE